VIELDHAIGSFCNIWRERTIQESSRRILEDEESLMIVGMRTYFWNKRQEWCQLDNNARCPFYVLDNTNYGHK
jgi:hypothetical protein